MPETRGVWGIDIGLAGLKAIRLVYAESAGQVLAKAFDYVPHPKILSQPDANPDELIAQALDTFLSRNSLTGDAVAISVPGQTALARFIQLPPVEASKVVEIVKYEARQQIPFALDEVIWDYQPLGAGVEESGFLLDAKVGLFAMKRDQVQQHLAPFLQRKIEVDLVQIAPLALYNFLCHDRLGAVPGKKDVPEEEETYTLLLDMGADNTTLLVSNGKDIWIRNVPLGGNHFTRALTKDMKLTFAKAEHLKCNATKAPDPKAVFQSLRPVFNDYVAEIQRSIGFFSSVNRDAKIGRIVGVGNGFKLAGLQKFLQQNLQMEVERVDSFHGVAGDAVLNAPLFQENLLSFAVPYGLALQGLKITRVHTSLLPPEITTARLIRKKKPWAAATAATLLAGLALSTMGYAHVLNAVSADRFKDAEAKGKEVIDNKGNMKKAYDAAVAENAELKKKLDGLVEASKGRMHWAEMLRAVNECLPRDFGNAREVTEPEKKNRIRIMSITATKMDDLGQWFSSLDETKKNDMRESEKTKGPSGKGYVIRLEGRHYHNSDDFEERGVRYVVHNFLENLQKWRVDVKDPESGAKVGEFPVRQLGITHAAITYSLPVSDVIYYEGGPNPLAGRAPVPVPARAGGTRGDRRGGADAGDEVIGGAPARRGPARPTPAGRTGADAGDEVIGAPTRRGAARPAPAGRTMTSRKRKRDRAVVEIKEEGDADRGRPIPQTSFTIEFAWKETPEEERPEADPDAATASAAGAAGAPAAGGPPAPAAPATPPAAPAAPAGPATLQKNK